MGSKKVSAFWEHLREVTPGMDDSERSQLCQKAAGVKQATASRWKTGTNTVSRRHILLLCQKIGCTVDWLEVGDGRKWVQPAPDKDIEKGMTLLQAIPKAEIPGLLRILDYMVTQARLGLPVTPSAMIARDMEDLGSH